MALVNLDELYVVCRENDARYMHSGYYSRVAPKFYLKGFGNEVAASLNRGRASALQPLDSSSFNRQFFSEEDIQNILKRRLQHIAEEERRGPWVVRKASEIFAWKL